MSDETTPSGDEPGAIRASDLPEADAQPAAIHDAAPAAPDEPLPAEPVTSVPLEPVTPVEPAVLAEPVTVAPLPTPEPVAPVSGDDAGQGDEPSAPAQAAANVKAKAEEAAGSVGATAAGVASTVQTKADQATTTVTATADEKPEIPIGVAFAGGFLFAKILKAIGS